MTTPLIVTTCPDVNWLASIKVATRLRLWDHSLKFHVNTFCERDIPAGTLAEKSTTTLHDTGAVVVVVVDGGEQIMGASNCPVTVAVWVADNGLEFGAREIFKVEAELVPDDIISAMAVRAAEWRRRDEVFIPSPYLWSLKT